MLSPEAAPTCVLYVPAAAERLGAALEARPDALILDLEDGTPPDDRPRARRALPDLVAACRSERLSPIVRINGRGTPWHADDVEAVAGAAPDAVLVPKVAAEDVAAVAERVVGEGIRVWALVESARALLTLPEITGAGASTFVLGYGDLCASLGLPLSTSHPELDGARRSVLAEAARSALVPLDGVVLDREPADVEAACFASFAQGFRGRTLYHHRHVEACRRAWRRYQVHVSGKRK